MSSWSPLGSLPPRELTEARLEMHHAVQLVAIAVGRSLIPRRDDDSHTTLQWLEEAKQWIGQEVPGLGEVRAGFRPDDLTLTLGTAAAPAEHRLALSGGTLEDGLAWLRGKLGDLGQAAETLTLDSHYEMPPHRVAEGDRFRGELAAGFCELARYFANGTRALEKIRGANKNSSAVLTWPHHFDAGLLISLGEGKSVGVGLSPGDGAYPEPYFYVNAYPRPDTEARPALPRGHWHTEGFFAAVLTATDLLSGDDDGQEARVEEFLSAAVAGSRSLLV